MIPIRGRLARCVAATFVLAAASCSPEIERPSGATDQDPPEGLVQDYQSLLSKHEPSCQGYGPDPYGNGERHQPMTYGLVLSAETTHFLGDPTPGGRARIRSATRWLVDNADLDRDGLPGWGLPDAWDAFGDGSTNPSNHPYTITTAIVAHSFLDAIETDRQHPSLLPEEDEEDVRRLLRASWRRWAASVWSGDRRRGYFWYSSAREDAYFVPNVSAMWAGVGARLVDEPWIRHRSKLRGSLASRTRAATRSLVERVTYRGSVPYWPYTTGRRYDGPSYPNDLVHQVYIVMGLEAVRESGLMQLPWRRRAAARSLLPFLSEGKIYAYPQDVAYESNETFGDDPAQLWSPGALLAYLGMYGDPFNQTPEVIRVVRNDYGPLGSPRVWPRSAPEEDTYQDDTYYPRHGAHLLWGLAEVIW